MKKVKNKPGGWMWYSNNVRTEIGRPLTEQDCRELMLNKYMKGVSWEDAAQEMMNETV